MDLRRVMWVVVGLEDTRASRLGLNVISSRVQSARMLKVLIADWSVVVCPSGRGTAVEFSPKSGCFGSRDLRGLQVVISGRSSNWLIGMV